jgi:hypothetical protein
VQSPAIRARWIPALGVLWLALLACQREEKVVKYRPFFTGLSGTAMGTEPVNAGLGAGLPANEDDSAPDASGISTAPDGTTIMRARSARQLMVHITKTILDNDAEAFAGQVLSQASRQEYIDRGLDPREAFALATAQRQDIGRLFKRMPMGEHTPFVIMRKLGAKVYRVELTGQSADDLVFRGFDMVMEESYYKLRWFF